MPRCCKTTCVACNTTFDRYSGQLLNLSDSCLSEFYKCPSIQSAISQGQKHPTLCFDCLSKELGRKITAHDFKFKGKTPHTHWYTSNLLSLLYHTSLPLYKKYLPLIQENDRAGISFLDHSSVHTIISELTNILKYGQETNN